MRQVTWPNEIQHISASPIQGRYIVGRLEDFKHDDPTFDDLDLARIEAVTLSARKVPNAFPPAYAVWDTLRKSDCIAIAYMGVLYEPKQIRGLSTRDESGA